MPPTCPRCAGPIQIDDINVAKDTALCRACGGMLSYADLVHADAAPPLAGVDLADPPHGVSLNDYGSRFELVATTRSPAMALFMIFFAAFWNSVTWLFVGLGVTGLLGALNVTLPAWWPAPSMGSGGMGLGMSIFLLLFITPFVLIGLLTLVLALIALAGSCRVEIDGARGLVSTGVGPLRWKRRFDAAAVTRVAIEHANSSTNGKPDRHIVIDGPRPVSFGTMLTPARRRWMAAALRTLLLPERR